MANQQGGARPSMRVLLIVPEAGRVKSDQDGGGREDKFLEVGAAWETQNGGLRFTLDVIPARMLAGESATFVLSRIEQRNDDAPRGNPQRGGRR
jgi:hypothetical protein